MNPVTWNDHVKYLTVMIHELFTTLPLKPFRRQVLSHLYDPQSFMSFRTHSLQSITSSLPPAPLFTWFCHVFDI